MRIKKMQKIATFSLCFMITCFIGLGGVLWMAHHPIDPDDIAVVQSPAEVITKEIDACDYLEYHFVADVYRDYPVKMVRRKLKDGISFNLDPTYPKNPEMGHIEVIQKTNQIPCNTPSGYYTMEFEAIHAPSPFREVSVHWETGIFYVNNE